MVLALDSFIFSFVALSEWCWFIVFFFFSEPEGFPFSWNWLLLRELVRVWLLGLDIISHFWIPWVLVGFQFLDSSIVFVFNLIKIIILGTLVVGTLFSQRNQREKGYKKWVLLVEPIMLTKTWKWVVLGLMGLKKKNNNSFDPKFLFLAVARHSRFPRSFLVDYNGVDHSSIPRKLQLAMKIAAVNLFLCLCRNQRSWTGKTHSGAKGQICWRWFDAIL